jgi:triosephosphate isomerase
MNKKLIVGNWKMNGSLAANEALIAGLLRGPTARDCEMVLCVPHVYLLACAHQLRASAIALGAQDVAAQSTGAYTGDVSAGMLADVGCRYVLIGHSERRLGHGETDQLLSRKLASALAAGLRPILCVGETASEYAVGATMAVLKLQLRSALLPLAPEVVARVVIAYEPVWAIGTGLSAAPEVVARVHAFIRQELTDIAHADAAGMPVLYGGSMKPDNAAALLALPGVDGGLIGGASLDAAQFAEIVRAVPR